MQYQFDNFVLDPDNFELRQNDATIELRAKAFHVLAFLLKNRHRMVSKDELLDEVWHKQFIAESTLNSCIKTVRHALGDDGQNQKIIQTVRGKGYRFISPVEMVNPAHAQEHTISKRLGERFEKTFVGRDKELLLVMKAIAQPVMPFWICYLYGSGGIGKTSILKTLCRKASDSNFVIYFDCREHEPTEEAFLQSLANIILSIKGINKKEDKIFSLTDISSLLSELDMRVLLCIDQFESYMILESWLRRKFFPALPDSVLTVIACREAPKSSWYASSEWAGAFRMLEVGELSETDASTMLKSRNLDDNQINRVKKFAKGYPLALELAALLCRTQPGYEFSENRAPIEIISELATSVLSDLPDVEKEAVEALSTVHRANEPILCALLGLKDAQKLFVKLRELPFVNYSTQGISLHDVVREAIGNDLSYRDPVRCNQYRQNAWKFLKDELDKIPQQKQWTLSADLLFLIEAPVVREAYFPVGSSGYTIQPASSEDTTEILTLSNEIEPGKVAGITEKWLDNYPEHFYVAKSENNKFAGFEVFFSPDKVKQSLLKNDPVSQAWLNHLEDNPVNDNEQVIFYRRWLVEGTGDALSPVQGAFWKDIKRVYMEMRPHLRRLYACFTNLEEYEPVCLSVGFKILDDCHVDIDGKRYYTAMIDFGANSIDGWLVKLVKDQLNIE